MLILACDTTNHACSVCLSEDKRVIAESYLMLGLTHSQTFMPMLHELMKRSGYAYKDLDAFACTVGPGSFTGIRIGVSACKVMAMVAKKPAIPVSSLCALAYPLFSHKDTIIAPMIDARNERVFSAAYYNGIEVIKEAARTIDEFVMICDGWRDLHAQDSRILTCGNAGHMYGTADVKIHREDVLPRTDCAEIRAQFVAAIACETAEHSLLFEQTSLTATTSTPPLFDSFPPRDLTPYYLAKTSAERALEKKKDEKNA